jgi:aminoglycoside phosphotransferase (APT) family kinase protein
VQHVAPDLEDFARTQVRDVLGSDNAITHLAVMQAGDEQSVLQLTLSRPPKRLVLKVARPGTPAGVDFERSAAVSALGRAAGVPTPLVLAAKVSHESGRWSYLLQERVDGVEWRQVRPLLDPDQVRAAHRQIATTLLAIQSIHFASFGELNAAGEVAGNGLVTALRGRAEIRITDAGRRTLFVDVLERDADLFVDQVPILCHDDLHHANVIFRRDGGRWRLAAVLDWDKAWAGPAESDLARMAFWDDMTGAGFWEVYDAAIPPAHGRAERALVYQLLWCLEYPASTPRHRADTAAVCRRLGVEI